MRVLALLGVACLALALLFGGTAPFARVALSLGLPGLAATLATEPAWRGVALYRAGRHEEAAEAFRAAGDPLGLGNSQVRLGNYAAALEAFDIGRMRGDSRAEANFNLVSAYYAGLALEPETPIAWFTDENRIGDTVLAPVGQGSARAASDGTETTNSGALLGLPDLKSWAETSGTRRVFDDKFMVANSRWLANLADVPGAYLDARIEAERKRRDKAGLAPPEPEDPR
ncbi:hypothetical protein [Litorisediminicola beolgyonensis]|uniref:Tetratricopeptide repeat protein n=1 Tax=Litorisediminicola beolgyonensis TaxID=1173614 RepID=A0ABW3ZIZ7_9RHOB